MSEEHHEFGPSTLELFDYCSGAYQMIKMAKKEEVESEDALNGTLMHKIVENFDKVKNDPDFTVDQIESAKKCVDKLELIAPFDKWQKEVKVTTYNEDFEELNFGTIDAVHEGDIVYAGDWKFGRNPVTNCEYNLQALNYSVALIQKYGKPVHFFIFQEPMNNYTEHIFDLDSEKIFFEKFHDIKSRCEDQTQLCLRPSYRCSWCDAMKICPMAQTQLNNTEIAKIEHTSELSHEKIYEYFTQWKMIKKIGENLENTVKFKLMKGEEIDGFYLKNISGNRFVNDPQKAYDIISDIVSTQDFMSCIDIKLGKLEEIYIEKRIEKEKTTKKAAKEELYNRIGELVERQKDKTSLACRSKKENK